MTDRPHESEPSRDRLGWKLLLPALGGTVVAAAFGLGAFMWLPPASGAPLIVAAGWLAIAGLLGPAMAVDAVAHERLQTDAFDPIAGGSTRRLEVNRRFLQNTIEQYLLFASGMTALAADGLDSRQFTARLFAGLTVSWLAARYLFWIGYHRSAGLRVLGAIGLAYPLVMLAVAAARFGGRNWGTSGWALPLVLLGAIEVILFRTTRDKSRQPH